MKARNITERLDERLDRSGGPTACWLFRGATVKGGYGRLVDRGRHVLAHRVAFERANGPIPAGKFVLHSCDNPPCCNPAHHFLGDAKVNAQDRDAKGRGLPSIRYGSANHAAKCADHVVEIRVRVALGESLAEVAAAFGVSRQAIHAIVDRRAYAYVA